MSYESLFKNLLVKIILIEQVINDLLMYTAD